MASPLTVSVYRITNDNQEQAVGSSFLNALVTPEMFERASAYIAGCGRFYHVDRYGQVWLYTAPREPREKVAVFVDELESIMAPAGIPIKRTETTTGSEKLEVEFSDIPINIVITAARRT